MIFADQKRLYFLDLLIPKTSLILFVHPVELIMKLLGYLYKRLYPLSKYKKKNLQGCIYDSIHIQAHLKSGNPSVVTDSRRVAYALSDNDQWVVASSAALLASTLKPCSVGRKRGRKDWGGSVSGWIIRLLVVWQAGLERRMDWMRDSKSFIRFRF